VEHSINIGHRIDFSSTIVLARTSGYMDCLVKEAIGIRLSNKNINRDDGLMLSQVWNPVVNMLSNQKARLVQPALDSTSQSALASTPS
jgi:hypothetical protein